MTKTIAMIVAVTFLSLNVFAHEAKHAKGKGGHKHRHGAHVHGEATLAVAFEGTSGQVDFRSPSDAIYGFEHEPKNEKQKAAVDESLKMLESHIEMMLEFPISLGCKFTKEKVSIERESAKSKHAETVAVFKVACDKSPAGASVNLAFHEHFPNIKVLKATFVVDSMQKSMDVKQTSGIQL